MVRRVHADAHETPSADEWFRSVPATAHVLARDWELTPATVLVGKYGSGKSTLIEAIARAFGMGAEGGSTGSRHATRTSESTL